MALTRNNVAYNFKESPFHVTITYEGMNCKELRFVFSSELNRNKFIARLGESRMRIEESLSKRFKMQIKLDCLSDINLYKSVEKRGFLIISESEEFTCPNNITFDGNKVISTN